MSNTFDHGAILKSSCWCLYFLQFSMGTAETVMETNEHKKLSNLLASLISLWLQGFTTKTNQLQ